VTGPAGRQMLAAAVALAVAAAVAGCGLSTDDEAERIPPEAFPAELVEQTQETSATVANADPNALVYLVDDSQTDQTLRCVAVEVPVTPGRTDLATELDDLMRWLTGDDPVPLAGLSRVTLTLTLVDVLQSSDRSGVFQLNFDGLDLLQGPSAELAIASIVFTATEVDGVQGVLFLENGDPVAVAVEGSQVASEGETIDRGDYPSLAASLPADPCPTEAIESSEQPTTTVPATTTTLPTDTVTSDTVATETTASDTATSGTVAPAALP
jgi:hypothetical protein